ncbi:hypothetical protein AX17_003643 [Amanita inopinata Kibby_2008]|nr:hypothetical protein AX17_003643 [Amanita inopinata Kibby_2008]
MASDITTLVVSYKTPFSTRLYSTLLSIGQSLRIMSSPSTLPYDAEFQSLQHEKRSVEIHFFRDGLHKFYTLPEAKDIPHDRWTVTKIDVYKQMEKRSRHEFLVAHLCNKTAHSSHHVYFRVHRTTPIEDTTNKQGDDSSKTPLISSNLSDSCQKRRASDTVDFVDLEKINGTHLFTLQLEGGKDETKISLPQLVILALAVNSVCPAYHILKNNCLWFTYAVVEAIQVLFPGAKVIDTPEASVQGTWHNIRLNNRNSVSMSSIAASKAPPVVPQVLSALPEQAESSENRTDAFYREWVEFVGEIRHTVHDNVPYLRAKNELALKEDEIRSKDDRIKLLEAQVADLKRQRHATQTEI